MTLSKGGGPTWGGGRMKSKVRPQLDLAEKDSTVPQAQEMPGVAPCGDRTRKAGDVDHVPGTPPPLSELQS